MNAMQILRQAMKLEQDGLDFYLAAAERAHFEQLMSLYESRFGYPR